MRGWWILSCAVLVVRAGAETYVVAPGGDDSGPGSEAKPWKSLTKASRSVQAGDTVRIKAGEYFVGPTWRLDRPGKEGSPITFQAFGDGEVRISGAVILPADQWKHVKGKIYSTPLDQPALDVFCGPLPLHGPGERAKIFSVDDLIANSFYVKDKVLYVWLADGTHPKDSVMRTASGHVVSLYDCSYTVLDGLTVEFGFNGIKLQKESTHHITIRNCTIRSIASQGIQPVAKDCIIEKNLFSKIGSNKYEHGIYGSQPGTIIRHNIFEEISGAGIHQYNQTKPAGGKCEFYGNVFRKPRAMTERSAKDRYYLDIIAWGEGGNLIYNNVFFGEGKRGGISLNSIDNKVFNNTFVASTYGVGFHANKPGNVVMNNIVSQASRTFVVWPKQSLPQTLDYNLYFNTTGGRWEHDGVAMKSFDQYQKASGEAHARYGDPKLGPDGRPLAGSAAIDAGTAIKDVAVDAAGNKRAASGADVGAFESK